MLGWIGLAFVLFSLWWKWYVPAAPFSFHQTVIPPLADGDRPGKLGDRRLDDKQMDEYYQNLGGERYLGRCYPNPSDQFRQMFQEHSGSANSGLRIGDVPPEIFY